MVCYSNEEATARKKRFSRSFQVRNRMTAQELLDAIANRTPENINRIVEGFMPTVLRITTKVKSRVGNRIQMDDLFQAGCLGLMHAAREYDEKHGTKFITYAHRCIHGYIMSYVARNYSLIRCPIQMQWDLLMGRLGDEASEMVQGIQNTRELDEVEDFDSRKCGSYWRRGVSSGETIPMNKEWVDRDEKLDADDLDRTMKAILSSREYDILTCRAKSYTLKEIGAKHGVSKERARQIESVAIAKVKAHYGVGYKYA